MSSLGGASAWPAEVSASEEVQRVLNSPLAGYAVNERGLSTYKVVAEELHDESRVLVALLAEGVELCDGRVSWHQSKSAR